MDDADPSAVVVPFGKHRGATVAELIVKDQPYVEWLMGQGWLATRFAELHKALATRGAGTDDSPEHNAIQARFLDPAFREAAVMLGVNPWTPKDAVEGEIRAQFVDMRTTAAFEVDGVDVLVRWTFGEQGYAWERRAAFEIKPTMGDDFPTVMRQMDRLRARVLVLCEYTGRGATEAQMRQMFTANNKQVVFLREIEAEMAKGAGGG